jgi:hypothetical protein
VLPMITKGLQSINLEETSSGMCGVMLLLLGCGPLGILPLLLRFRMRVSAAPFFGACQRWSAAAARQHDRTNRDHVHAADSFPDHGLVERIIEAVAPC